MLLRLCKTCYLSLQVVYPALPKSQRMWIKQSKDMFNIALIVYYNFQYNSILQLSFVINIYSDNICFEDSRTGVSNSRQHHVMHWGFFPPSLYRSQRMASTWRIHPMGWKFDSPVVEGSFINISVGIRLLIKTLP